MQGLIEPQKGTVGHQRGNENAPMQLVAFFPFVRWEDADPHHDIGNGQKNAEQKTDENGVAEKIF